MARSLTSPSLTVADGLLLQMCSNSASSIAALDIPGKWETSYDGKSKTETMPGTHICDTVFESIRSEETFWTSAAKLWLCLSQTIIPAWSQVKCPQVQCPEVQESIAPTIEQNTTTIRLNAHGRPILATRPPSSPASPPLPTPPLMEHSPCERFKPRQLPQGPDLDLGGLIIPFVRRSSALRIAVLVNSARVAERKANEVAERAEREANRAERTRLIGLKMNLLVPLNSSFNNDTSSWTGFNALENLFILYRLASATSQAQLTKSVSGDSYSSVGQFASDTSPPAPVDRQAPFEGSTFADKDGTNWVGYILTQHDPHSKMVVHDYAVGGARVPASGQTGSVERQISEYFLTGYAMKPEDSGELLWKSENSLFVTWVGINDCASASTHDETVNLLFTLQHKLYDAGARQFLFIDVPPISRSPAGIHVTKNKPDPTQGPSTSNANWNASLRAHMAKFAAAHPDARILTFSAFQMFNDMLDHPKRYGLPQKDVAHTGGKVWRDALHPTSRVHEIFAAKLVAFLKEVV
ncbi:Glycosyltransferase family 32 protein [Mycena indigotica]|uniref:Glycosyltransferase family 32 protein n=1 Tax=Mycena indigotica TaxID=2126181 RepID=A0A8H6RZZ9_9AGAR|nr:Glycosyltransferase family 32 protein [Mycena indigotica]KAF7290825.1 Glycosyltransferase family 32 protein [Mycena indigotica]